MYHTPHLQGTEKLHDQDCGFSQIPPDGGRDQGQGQCLMQQGQGWGPQGQEVEQVSPWVPQYQAPCFQVVLG